ncbi:lysylphosphatidylglycerol synthetase-like protein (DUF2156 family) [Gracilibacillus halotolerans]|uniref:Lysylphosphatidylglycerol synthetase-like protein (DUF2156 family) n=1 Tax=Gracilibacillus halotolerans TaxID=74386 RepID=A0A841RUF6_9BACI|nr:hypothetical protein [Gracilibacillus halotolerans]MBB6514108.1 lysylphosphatidylglycerol synthetase-like protein (DUF2156 family) [Gracilibacillus halotolerans]
MEKIKDERLILRNLKNIRIAYIIQTAGILGILGYDIVTKGFDGMRENPLWILFMVSIIVSAYLSMNVSVDYESGEKSPKKGFLISFFIVFLISSVIGILTSLSEGFTIVNGVIIGGILLVCGLIPIVYIYYLRTKRQNEN